MSKVSALTGLELRRKTWEALGWTIAQVESGIGLMWRTCDPQGQNGKCAVLLNSVLVLLQPIESSNGIAVDELLKLMAANHWVADIRIGDAGHAAVALRRVDESTFFVDCYGRNLAEATCTAIIAAKES